MSRLRQPWGTYPPIFFWIDADADRASTSSSIQNLALVRDGYRCLITGALETDRWEQLSRPADELHGTVQAAQIIPFAMASSGQESSVFVCKPPHGPRGVLNAKKDY